MFFQPRVHSRERIFHGANLNAAGRALHEWNLCSGARTFLTSRRNERRPIFRNDGDRRHFLASLEELVGRYRLRLHGYVLMENFFTRVGTDGSEPEPGDAILTLSDSIRFKRVGVSRPAWEHGSGLGASSGPPAVQSEADGTGGRGRSAQRWSGGGECPAPQKAGEDRRHGTVAPPAPIRAENAHIRPDGPGWADRSN